MHTDTVHPLAATLTRMTALDEQFRTDLGLLAEGWWPAIALVQVDSPLLTKGLAHAVARYPNAERRVAGSFLLGTYAWYLAGTAIASYLAEQRVPDLHAANVAVRFNTYTWHEAGASGEAERLDLRLLSGRFAALPDDMAANHPDTLVLPTAEALRDWLRQQLEQHLSILVDAIFRHTRLGKRAQWSIVADTIASLFQHFGEKLTASAHAQAEGLTLIQASNSPLRVANTGYVTLEYQGQCATFVQRGGCCLYYKVEPGNNCATCVLRREEDRKQLLLKYMARKYDSQ